MEGFQARGPRLVPVESGEWTGWSHDAGDAYEILVGPYYARQEPDGRIRCAFRTEARHMNGGGFLHGGAMMSFADYSLFCIAREALEDAPGVTATFDGAFIGTVREGALVECTGEVLKAGRSLVFVRGLVTSGDDVLMNFSAVIKKVARRSPGPAT